MSEDAETYITASAADDTAAPCEKATRPAATGGGENSVDRRQATELRQLILIGSLLAAYCRDDEVVLKTREAAADANALAIAWDDLLPAVRGTLIAAESR